MKKKKKYKNNEKLLNKLHIIKPETRGDCVDGIRPCPFISCRHHMMLEVNEYGKIKYVFPGVELPEQMKIPSCLLDIVDEYPSMTLEDIGSIMNITRERARQIHDAAFRKLRPS